MAMGHQAADAGRHQAAQHAAVPAVAHGRTAPPAPRRDIALALADIGAAWVCIAEWGDDGIWRWWLPEDAREQIPPLRAAGVLVTAQERRGEALVWLLARLVKPPAAVPVAARARPRSARS